MISLLKRIFIEHWVRKLFSLVLAIIVWLVVNHSMKGTKTIVDVPVRVINLEPGKTIEGMQANGLLNEMETLTLSGRQAVLDLLSSKDLEVVLDAAGKPNEWRASIGKEELSCLNAEINLQKGISRVLPVERLVRQTKLVEERIPITITEPIGEAPKGYRYLDIFPYRLDLTVLGPEETVKWLKSRGGLQLTFNLNDISSSELDILQSNNKRQSDEVSFFIPNAWKKLAVPGLSEVPIPIDDPKAKGLRIDFARQDLFPIHFPIPISLFFPPDSSETINPETCALAVGDFIVKKNGVMLIDQPLFAQGVSRRFLDLVKGRIQILITVPPQTEGEELLWNVQFVCPQELEDRFVAKSMADLSYELKEIQPTLREEYLRNRFCSYMNSFRFYTPNHKKLRLAIRVVGSAVQVVPEN